MNDTTTNAATARTDRHAPPDEAVGHDSVLLVGGYGTVGSQVARMLRRREADLPLVLAGRRAAAGAPLAEELGGTVAVSVDIHRPGPLADARLRHHLGVRPVILVAVNDPHDHVLADAVAQGLPLIDIARWTDRHRRARSRLALETLRAPVLLGSGWMAGAVAMVAAQAAAGLAQVESIDLAVLYGLGDRAGPDSVAYMDRLAIPFEVPVTGGHRRVTPLSGARSVRFSSRTTRARRFDVPDHDTLAAATGAATVEARIAFDQRAANTALAALVRSGIWRLLSRPRFDGLRRSVLYSPGEGAPHEVRIEVAGRDAEGRSRTSVRTLLDPAGQSHLTAAGATVLTDWVLTAAAPHEVLTPEQHPDLAAAITSLAAEGIRVRVGPDGPGDRPTS